jgi:hypothetical protein
MQNTYKRGNTFRLVILAVFIFSLACFTSCEKEVNIKLDSGESNIVVEGTIETGLPPYVFLTKSIGYFAQIDLNTLQNSFIHDAVVKVSDGSKEITLKEYSIDTGKAGNKLFFYSIDTAVLPYMVGEINKFYKLTIQYNGKVYEATTKVPNPTPLDSVLSVPPEEPFNKTKYPNAREVRIAFKDPDTLTNYVRYYTKRNSEPMYPGLNSVYSDEVINGTKFATTFPLGEPRSSERADTLGTAHVGDTVVFKWSAIDKATYDFWSSYEYSLGTLGNPFSTPIKVKGNISNNALGIWGGYGSLSYTIIMK